MNTAVFARLITGVCLRLRVQAQAMTKQTAEERDHALAEIEKLKAQVRSGFWFGPMMF